MYECIYLVYTKAICTDSSSVLFVPECIKRTVNVGQAMEYATDIERTLICRHRT